MRSYGRLIRPDPRNCQHKILPARPHTLVSKRRSKRHERGVAVNEKDEEKRGAAESAECEQSRKRLVFRPVLKRDARANGATRERTA